MCCTPRFLLAMQLIAYFARNVPLKAAIARGDPQGRRRQWPPYRPLQRRLRPGKGRLRQISSKGACENRSLRPHTGVSEEARAAYYFSRSVAVAAIAIEKKTGLAASPA